MDCMRVLLDALIDAGSSSKRRGLWLSDLRDSEASSDSRKRPGREKHGLVSVRLEHRRMRHMKRRMLGPYRE